MSKQYSNHSQMCKQSPIITGLGIWSVLGDDLPNTIEHLFLKKPRQNELLDFSEANFLKLNRHHKKLNTLKGPMTIDSHFFTPNLFALIAVEEALEQAGLSADDLKKMRVGVCLGSTVGGTNYNDRFAEEFYTGQFPDRKILENFFKTNSAQFLSRYYQLQGPVSLVSNTCTSSLDSLGIALNWLNADLCDLVICGGTDTMLSRMYYGFKSLMLTSSEALCRPFDKNRKGFVLSEGAGMMIIEKNSSPRKALTSVRGFGTANDAYNPTAPHPEARGLHQAALIACAQAHVSFDQIDFVSAHGVGTEQNDLVEGQWLKRYMKNAKVAALKGHTGHSMGANGAISLILTSLCLQRQTLPDSKGFVEMDESIGLTPTQQIESGDFQNALCISLGIGGINSAVCLGNV